MDACGLQFGEEAFVPHPVERFAKVEKDAPTYLEESTASDQDWMSRTSWRVVLSRLRNPD